MNHVEWFISWEESSKVKSLSEFHHNYDDMTHLYMIFIYVYTLWKVARARSIKVNFEKTLAYALVDSHWTGTSFQWKILCVEEVKVPFREAIVPLTWNFPILVTHFFLSLLSSCLHSPTTKKTNFYKTRLPLTINENLYTFMYKK